MFDKLITGFTGVPLSARNRKILIGILLAGLALRLLLMGVAHSQGGLEQTFEGSPDSINYLKMAKSIINGTDIEEPYFFLFGPGYAFFLAGCIILFKAGIGSFIFVNIVLSSLTVLFVFILSMSLFRSFVTASTAAVLVAFSVTSICLSCCLLSDTTYFLLFIVSLVLYLKALSNGGWRWFILAGLFTGASVLVRPIGQFWPLAMVIIAIVYLLLRTKTSGCHYFGRWEMLQKTAVAILLTLAITSVWMLHNHNVHGIYTMAFSSAGGPANVALITDARIKGVKTGEVAAEWRRDYLNTTGESTVPFDKLYRIYKTESSRIFYTYPYESFKTYLSLVWINLNEINYLHRSLLPDYKFKGVDVEYNYKGKYLNYASFILSMLGLLLLIWQRRFWAAIVLGLVYSYYASMIGFTQWQGSRLFFPGQIASSVLTAIVLVAVGRTVQQWLGLRRRLTMTWRVSREFTKRFIVRPVMNFNPEEHRYYVLWFSAAVLVPLVILFRKFIFSDSLLCGGVDTLTAAVFFRTLLLDYVRAFGSIPMWNPYIYGGLPFVDAFHTDIFYPFSMTKYIGEFYRSIGFTLIAHIWCAGIFMYLTAREFGLSKIASTISGVSFMFASYLISFIGPGHDAKIYVTTLFPLLILFTNRAFRSRPLLYFTLAGVVIGCMILSPHPQMSYYSLLALAAFGLYKLNLLYRANKNRRSLIVPMLGLSGAVALGLTISAIQFYPSFTYTMNDSPRVGPSQGYGWAKSFSIHQEELFSLIVPDFSGTDSWAEPELKYWGVNGFKDNSEYVGTIPLFLAILCLFYRRRKGALFWAAMAGCTLIYSLGDTTPLFKLYYHLVPLLSKVRQPSMSMFLFSFSVAMMAGFFVQSLMESRSERSPKFSPLFKAVLWGLPVTVTVIGLLYFLAGEETLRLYARIFHPWLLTEEGRGPKRFVQALAHLPHIKAGFLYASLLLWAVVLIVWLYVKKSVSTIILLVLPLLLICNSLRFNGRFINVIDFDEEYGSTPVIEFFKQRDNDDRVFSYGVNLNQQHLYDNGISITLGYHGNQLGWYNDLVYYNGRWAHSYAKTRFINLMNVGYILKSTKKELAIDGLGPIPLDTVAVFENEMIYRNHNRFPRAYLVGQCEVIPDRHEIYPLVLDGEADLREMVYLEEEPELEIADSTDVSATAEIEYYGLDSIRIEVNCSTNKLLCMSDNWYSAWHAYVDGNETKIYRAYGSFRAVEVPAGSKEVVFKYDSPIYHRGRALSILGTMIVIVVLGYYGFGYIRGRRKQGAVAG